MIPPARTLAQITREALSTPTRVACGVVLGWVVEAWADWRVIEVWANREPAPGAARRAVVIEDRGGRVVLLVPVRPVPGIDNGRRGEHGDPPAVSGV